jgi:hypothetical protein
MTQLAAAWGGGIFNSGGMPERTGALPGSSGKAGRSAEPARPARGGYPPGEVWLACKVAEILGGRYSTELGIDVDAGDAEVERWFLATTLFGARISARIAERMFGVLTGAGLVRIGQVRHVPPAELIGLLDAGGYLGLLGAGAAGPQLPALGRLAKAAGLDLRDLESALVRLSLAHGRVMPSCPAGQPCTALHH